MALLTYITLLALLNLSLGDDCVINNTPRHILWEKQLRKDLKCHNYFFEPPKLSNNETLAVDVKFILKYFSFSSDEEVLTLQTWMYISWKDERLKWDPDKYGGINETEISSSSIWAPTFQLFNSADSDDFDRFYFVRCKIKSDGFLLCMPRVVHKTRCSVTLKDYPYDVQKCTVQYGPWDAKYRTFNMNVTKKAMQTWVVEYGSQWLISDYKQESKFGIERQLNMTLTFEREALSLAAVIVYPALIISGLSIACLFLDVRTNVRLGLVCFSILSHYYWLAELADNIPKETPDSPRLLLYYRGSFVLTVLMFMLTFVLAMLCKKETAPHNIVVSINDFVYGSFARFLVYPRWDIEGIVLTDENKFNEDWTKFANVVNSLSAIVIVCVYVGLYIAFIPQPVPLNY